MEQKRTNKQLRERAFEIKGRIEVIELAVENPETTTEQLDEIITEAEQLKEELEQINEEMRSLAKKSFERGKEVKIEMENSKLEALKERGEAYKQKRAIQLADLDILKPKHTSETLNPAFESVSGLADRVLITNVNGGETYEKGYVKEYALGKETAEGVLYTDTEPTFAYATITKVKLTAYTEVSEELIKLAPEAYAVEVERNLGIAIRRKLVQEILAGQGGAGHFTGIFGSPSAISAANDIEITTIDENTLNRIVLAYGSDEEVTDGVLILSKATLLDFSKVRGTQDKKPVYNIDFNARTINGVPYIITSHLKGIAEAEAGNFLMAYGAPTNYEVAVFSPVEAQRSDDYMFKNGQIAYKASGFFGGNVTVAEGFVRVKKGA